MGPIHDTEFSGDTFERGFASSGRGSCVKDNHYGVYKPSCAAWFRNGNY